MMLELTHFTSTLSYPRTKGELLRIHQWKDLESIFYGRLTFSESGEQVEE